MALERGEFRLQPRQLGIARQDIATGEFGTCLFEKTPGAGDYVDIECKAIEYVRENHEIWVIDNNNGVTEHTPQELRSETAAEIPYRVTDENPLPVTMGKGGNVVTYVTVTCTASGNTEIVAAPASGYKIRVHYLAYGNKHTTIAVVGLRFGASGDIKHAMPLASEGGLYNANLTDANWEGGDVEALNANLAAAYADGVYVTVGYTIEAV